jgi:signal transduction histidine kinase
VDALVTSLYDPLHQGLDAIRIRSEGLYNFTKTYRKLATIPKLSLAETNLNEIVHRVQVLMASDFKERGIALTVTTIDHPVMADPALMEHVLINLLLNAIDAVAGKAAPAIYIYTTLSVKGQVSIHVRDNGEGMNESTLEKIFIPFYTTKKNGSGIGLAITKQILQLHHADIRVNSSPAQGTEFIITLNDILPGKRYTEIFQRFLCEKPLSSAVNKKAFHIAMEGFLLIV